MALSILTRYGERAWPGPFKDPVEDSKENPGEQVGAEPGVEVLAVSHPCAQGKTERAGSREERDHRPEREIHGHEYRLVEPGRAAPPHEGDNQAEQQDPPCLPAPDRDHRREQVDGKEQLEKTVRESQSPAQRHHGEREQERVEQERVAAVAERMPQATGTAGHPGAECTYHGTLLRSKYALRDLGWCPTCGDRPLAQAYNQLF